MSQMQDPVARARELVRRGDFVGAARDCKLIDELERVLRRSDPWSNQPWLSSRALLAEISDQTGQYTKAAEIFEDWEKQVKSCFRSLNDQATSIATTEVDNAWRRLFRAKAFFIAQAAIHKMRASGPSGTGLDVALGTMSRCQQLVERVHSEHPDGYRFHSVLRLLHYWEGRVEIARNQPGRALAHFNESMRHSEKNLHYHYFDMHSKIRPVDERIAYEVYSLASSMAFGVAHLNHIAGHLKEALDLLRPAAAMLMATGDNYRRAYAQMLIGAAERALAGAEPDRIETAISILEGSLNLFGRDSSDNLRHSLHEARVRHQLALAYVYRAQSLQRGSAAADSCFEKAKNYIQIGLENVRVFEDLGFGDPELRYDLSLALSRILRHQRDYDNARQWAHRALAIATQFQYAPSFSHAKAYVAKAETFLGEFSDLKPDKPGSHTLLSKAQSALNLALDSCEPHSVIAIVAHLYEAKISVYYGDIRGGRRKYHEAWDRREKQIQNGWVRQLAREVATEVEQPNADVPLNLDRLRDELRRAKEEGISTEPLWDEALHRLREFMVGWAEQSNPRAPWDELGKSKSSYFQNRNKRQRNDPPKASGKAAG
jgi:tetratricopeptide (TPR) repeat protein